MDLAQRVTPLGSKLFVHFFIRFLLPTVFLKYPFLIPSHLQRNNNISQGLWLLQILEEILQLWISFLPKVSATCSASFLSAAWMSPPAGLDWRMARANDHQQSKGLCFYVSSYFTSAIDLSKMTYILMKLKSSWFWTARATLLRKSPSRLQQLGKLKLVPQGLL